MNVCILVLTILDTAQFFNKQTNDFFQHANDQFQGQTKPSVIGIKIIFLIEIIIEPVILFTDIDEEQFVVNIQKNYDNIKCQVFLNVIQDITD